MFTENQARSRPIPGFENYFVSDEGYITNIRTGRQISLSPNNTGDYIVGLHKNGKQYTRSVKVLVAEAFVDGKTKLFDTPIQLNHVKEDLRADNIVWRPRWFAWKYARQFENIDVDYVSNPIREINSGIVYDNILHAAVVNGILCDHISMAIHNGGYVWPTNQEFEYI